MPITEATISGVVSRTQQRKSDGKAFTIYEITLDGEDKPKYQTFNRAIAAEANRMLNQLAEVSYHVEQSGMYENFYIDDVKLPTSRDFAPQPQQPDPQQQQPQIYVHEPTVDMSVGYTPIPEAPVRAYVPTEKDWSIWRQTAAKVSATLSSSPAEFWTNVDDLVTYFQTNRKPDRFQRYVPPDARDIAQAPVEQNGSNQFIPEGAAQAASEQYQTTGIDDDIPF